MLKALGHGVTAGAVGTAVLNTVTYLDMVLRDRPSSSVPAQTAEKATDLVGVSLEADDDDNDQGANRKQGVGALMGYVTGYAVGAAYGLLRPTLFPNAPRSIAGVGIAAAATISTVAPYSALGVSNPRTWGAKSWAADIIPHLCYGWATAAAFDALHDKR
jgi:hypothetical protein